MLNRLFPKKKAPLSGAPAVRRQKSYSAQSGYVYQYFYEGRREFREKDDHGTEYVFDVSADRKTSNPVSVLVGASALAPWQIRHGRELHETERYAIAKMALFQAFDFRETPARMTEPVRVTAAGVEETLATLEID